MSSEMGCCIRWVVPMGCCIRWVVPMGCCIRWVVPMGCCIRWVVPTRYSLRSPTTTLSVTQQHIPRHLCIFTVPLVHFSACHPIQQWQYCQLAVCVCVCVYTALTDQLTDALTPFWRYNAAISVESTFKIPMWSGPRNIGL